MSSNIEQESEIYNLIDSFFLKSSLLICSVVSQKKSQSPSFDEHWFQSNIKDTYNLPDIINKWISFDGTKTLPPLVIDVFLDLRELTPSNMVRLQDDDGNLWNVCKGTKKTEVMLERWLIELDDDSTAFKTYDPSQITDINTPDQLTLLLRYLHTLVKLLPMYELVKQEESHYEQNDLTRTYNSKLTPMIGARIVDGSKPILSKGRIGLSKPILGVYANVINDTNFPSHLEQKKITPVWTKFGLLRVSVSYRRDCKFVIEDTESRNLANPIPTHNPTDDIKRAKQVPSSNIRVGSLSPRSREYSLMSSFDRNKSTSNQNSFNQKKSISISRQVQPFKVGSVNSVVMNNQNISQNSSRNPSNSSFINSAQMRRTSNGSNTGYIGHLNTPSNHTLNIDSTSIDSGSKYMSSFGNLRRHSSINKNQEALANERKLLNMNKPAATYMQPNTFVQSEMLPEATEDILNFVKILDEKPDIKGKHPSQSNNSINTISSSLLKFQNLRPSNDLLSDDVSMSVSINPPSGEQLPQPPPPHIDPFIASYSPHVQIIPTGDGGRRRRSGSISHSHSPLPSLFSPSTQYPSIPSKLVGHQIEQEDVTGPIMRTDMLDNQSGAIKPRRPSYLDTGEYGPPHGIPNANSSGLNLSSRKNSIDEVDEDQDDELLVNTKQTNYGDMNERNIRGSSSPRSLDSISSSFHRNRLAYKQPYQQFSQPVIAEASVQAKMHKPVIQSTDILEDQDRLIRRRRDSEEESSRQNLIQRNNGRSDSNNRSLENNTNDDDEMVFFMSDMNLPHE
ncbi:similar to Saccharomyces cerevisiae YPR185W ATG13 Regulatory subunit of the Atg1p signaling complex [Maudiozyma saulgeensis]|uniref:Autophagy-related protein 13 n=1 Tax=Maudiozyma saulgeensis TaxID=1789683 RepID=A0A1X7RB64_9SACH|nr:similar to Saccharomyces cerevisiae YPR185W ATG13 Regulatory subunit of the Atg1p signaling complex [Kazachstania saulgeensis]